MTHKPLLGPVSDVNTYQMLIGGDFVDDSTCMSVARRGRAGTVWINTFMGGFPELPFGRYRQSGLGRELGRHAVEDYTETKTLTMHIGPRTGGWLPRV
jgi:acyl-CoA reductase-like NAD-dependent aldehyde dehydrogenase